MQPNILAMLPPVSPKANECKTVGMTGMRKSLIAKYIQYCHKSRGGSFINVNCAALPENLVEAELFGYEKEAFTGAAVIRKSLFDRACLHPARVAKYLR